MPCKETWGEKAKLRSKRRLEYFKEYRRKNPQMNLQRSIVNYSSGKKGFLTDAFRDRWKNHPHPRGMLGKIPWNKGKEHMRGEKHPNWKGGFSKTAEYHRPYKQMYKARKKGGGKLSVKTIQLVYEDNIKKYGTLTCVYCLKIIEFGKDTLEHKMPLIKGGTNIYENLAVACKSCNSRKRHLTEEEFKIKKEGGKP